MSSLLANESVAAPSLDLSVVAPAHNEEDNIAALVEDIRAALEPSGLRFEFVIVDDGSTDSTFQKITAAMNQYPWVRGFKMLNTPPGKGNGQSAAFHAGLRQARGQLIALLDADRQNDPADIPAMVAMLRQHSADMVQGDRSANRADTLVRKCSSWVGRTFRKHVIGDTIRDTGCSLRVFKRDIGLLLPLQFKGMHRFIPAYTRLLGFHVVECRVCHRHRTAGVAKYGVWNRALPGLRDLFAVRWMSQRLRPVQCQPISTDRRAS